MAPEGGRRRRGRHRLIVEVRAHPGASRPRLAWDGARLHAWVTAPAVDGRANQALVRLVAQALGLRPREVTLVRGEHSRDKALSLEDLPPERLAALPRPESR